MNATSRKRSALRNRATLDVLGKKGSACLPNSQGNVLVGNGLRIPPDVDGATTDGRQEHLD
eukprot:5217549-Lingulodinium_polyedra.AAC.1